MKGLGSIKNSTSPFFTIAALLIRNSGQISLRARPDFRILNSIHRAHPLANNRDLLLHDFGNENLGRARRTSLPAPVSHTQ